MLQCSSPGGQVPSDEVRTWDALGEALRNHPSLQPLSSPSALSSSSLGQAGKCASAAAAWALAGPPLPRPLSVKVAAPPSLPTAQANWTEKERNPCLVPEGVRRGGSVFTVSSRTRVFPPVYRLVRAADDWQRLGNSDEFCSNIVTFGMRGTSR